ncbi:MAG: MFS transporter [Candidatus Micrarchaeia archaeon]
MSTDLKTSFRYLLYSRIFRSIALIYMSLAFSLYLVALHISIINIGLVAASTMLFMVFISLIFGIIGDRKGYKFELLIVELITFIGALIIALSTSTIFIIIGMIIGGLSSGAGGMRGAFSPGSNAYIANNYKDDKERVKKYSLISMTASLASIVGSILFSSVSLLSSYVGLLNAYRYLFILSSILLGISVIFIAMLYDSERPAKTTKIMKKSSMHYSLRVIITNVFSGLGMGLVIPLLPLWFKLSYNASPLDIGIIFGAVYIATALGSFISSKIAHKLDTLNIVIYTRTLNGLFLFFMALSPALFIAGLFYIIRAVIVAFGSPSRTTINVKGIDSEDYGAATSVQGIAARIAQMSSGASGYLMDLALPLPIFIGALFQIASSISYKVLFKKK